MFWRDLGLFCGCWAVVFADGEAPFGVRKGRCGIWCYKTNGHCVCAKSFRRAYLLGIINARAAWMFHGRAYAGGRFVFLYRNASLGTP